MFIKYGLSSMLGLYKGQQPQNLIVSYCYLNFHISWKVSNICLIETMASEYKIETVKVKRGMAIIFNHVKFEGEKYKTWI